MLDFKKRLKALRKEKRKTQEDVAKFLKIQRATYSGYERGVIMPPYDKINALAKYFDVTVEYLMGEKPVDQVPTDAVKSLVNLLDELKDETGEPYDWIEVWNDKDDNGMDDLIITR